MKKLDVRFCLGYRIFDISSFRIIRLVWLSKFLSMSFFVVGNRGRSGRKVVFELIYHSYFKWVVKNLLGDYFRIWNWPMRGSCLNSPFTALMMPMMAKTNRRSHAKPNAMPTMPASA